MKKNSNVETRKWKEEQRAVGVSVCTPIEHEIHTITKQIEGITVSPRDETLEPARRVRSAAEQARRLATWVRVRI